MVTTSDSWKKLSRRCDPLSGHPRGTQKNLFQTGRGSLVPMRSREELLASLASGGQRLLQPVLMAGDRHR